MTATTQNPTPTRGADRPTRQLLPPALPKDDTRIPFGRLVSVEMRKLVDTRSGRWMLISIAALTVLAAGAMLIAVRPGEAMDLRDFLGTVGIPLMVLLPLLGILTVTSEWSQRTGLVTFALEPRRLRVAWAKLASSLIFGALVTAIGVAVAALTAGAAATFRDVHLTWSMPALTWFGIVVGQLLVVAMGVGLGFVLRNTTAAMITYFLVPTLFGMLGAISWMREPVKWLNTGDALQPFYNGSVDGEQWLQFATSHLLWVVLPLAAGFWILRRLEIK